MQALPAARVSEFQRYAGEQQPLHTEQFCEQPVVAALAVGRVADDRVRLARQVPAQLVPGPAAQSFLPASEIP